MPEKVEMDWYIKGLISKKDWDGMVQDTVQSIKFIKEGELPKSETVRIRIEKIE